MKCKLLAVTCFALSLVAATAHAQLFRAYLSIDGHDANPCTLQAPCRLLPKALAAVASNGEIWMLDSANYNTGTVSIDKTVTVLAVPGALGSLVSTGNSTSAIDIATPGITVSLRNVSIVPLATAPGTTVGLKLTAPSRVILEDSAVASFSGDGLQVQGGTLVFSHSTMRAVTGSGLLVGGTGSAMVSGSRFFGNGVGVAVATTSGEAWVTINDTVFSANSVGVRASTVSGQALATVNRSMIEGSTVAALDTFNQVSGVAQIVINGNSIQRNPGAGWTISAASILGATILSYGNNSFLFNGVSAGSITPPANLAAGSLQ